MMNHENLIEIKDNSSDIEKLTIKKLQKKLEALSPYRFNIVTKRFNGHKIESLKLLDTPKKMNIYIDVRSHYISNIKKICVAGENLWTKDYQKNSFNYELNKIINYIGDLMDQFKLGFPKEEKPKIIEYKQLEFDLGI